MTTINKWKAEDMRFSQVWNPDLGVHPEKRNFTLYAMFYRTPEDVSITVFINVEEGIVFLEDAKKTQELFENAFEMHRFIERAQAKFDQEVDMGKGASFIYGYGGKMKTLPEYQNENIEYLPIVYPNNEKYENPRYKEKVQWSLLSKGAIMIKPTDKEPYLAVIQRKHKPRDLTPFGTFIAQRPQPKQPATPVSSITLPKWLATNIGVQTEAKEITIQAVIKQETEKAILIQLQGKTNWLPKSKISIA